MKKSAPVADQDRAGGDQGNAEPIDPARALAEKQKGEDRHQGDRELVDADIELVRSSGGVFEISVDGALKFSKKALGRFPTDGEIDALATG